MATKTVVIEVSPTGEIKLEAKNFKGADCEKATKALEDALGVAGGRKKSPEWYQQTTGTQGQRA